MSFQRSIVRRVAVLLSLAALAGCGANTPGEPYGGGAAGGQGTGGSGGGGGYGGGDGGGAGGGGGGGGSVGTVAIGPGVQFVSGHNGSQNPAVDTIPAGGTVTWTWTGSLSHSVQSIGSTSFTSSTIRSGSGTYALTFTTPGTYEYDCAVHGSAMRGTIVVQ
jgi:plastocyanin